MTAQAFVFYIAGFETTSTTISYCLFEVARNADIQRRIHEEIDEVLSRHDRQITYESVSEMKYLESCIDGRTGKIDYRYAAARINSSIFHSQKHFGNTQRCRYWIANASKITKCPAPISSSRKAPPFSFRLWPFSATRSTSPTHWHSIRIALLRKMPLRQWATFHSAMDRVIALACDWERCKRKSASSWCCKIVNSNWAKPNITTKNCHLPQPAPSLHRRPVSSLKLARNNLGPRILHRFGGERHESLSKIRKLNVALTENAPDWASIQFLCWTWKAEIRIDVIKNI